MTASTGESRQQTKVTSREMSGLSGTDFARFRSVRSEGVGAERLCTYPKFQMVHLEMGPAGIGDRRDSEIRKHFLWVPGVAILAQAVWIAPKTSRFLSRMLEEFSLIGNASCKGDPTTKVWSQGGPATAFVDLESPRLDLGSARIPCPVEFKSPSPQREADFTWRRQPSGW